MALLAAPGVAAAELTERSPSTIEPHEVRLGISDVAVGLWGDKLLERMELSSRPLIWLTWVGRIPSYDIHAKFEFWHEGKLAMSVAAGVTQVDLTPLVGDVGSDQMAPQLAFRVIPVEGWVGYRLDDRIRFTAGAVYTGVSLRGHTQAGPIDELGGAIGTSNLEVHATGQLRMSRSWYLIAGARVLGY